MKPSELLIGLRELFAFVVPGASLLFLLPPAFVAALTRQIERPMLWPENETALLLVFVFTAYAVGAILSGVGSLFDDLAEEASSLKRFVPGLGRATRAHLKEAEHLEDLALRLENVALADLPERPGGPLWGRRAFWWNYLRIHCPQAVAEVDRLEAQQKLFRSLMVALLVLAVLAAIYQGAVPALLFAAGAIVSFFYYAGLRRTLSRRLFQCVVIQFVSDDLTVCGQRPE